MKVICFLTVAAVVGCKSRTDSSRSLDAQAASSAQFLAFKQWIDHSAQTRGTFDQRYLIDSSNAADDKSPVLFFIGGEAKLDASELAILAPHAKLAHAHIVGLEHRYYGKSFPVPDLSLQNLRYLTLDQAMGDLVTFIGAMKSTKKLQGPWIAMSGSYPGSLAAYLRALHPDLVAGAVASSAPVKAKEDFFEFDEHVNKVLSGVCANNIRRLMLAFDNAVSSDKKSADQMFTTFNHSPPNNDFGNLEKVALAVTLNTLMSEFTQSGNGQEALCKAVTGTDPLKVLADLAALQARYTDFAAGKDVSTEGTNTNTKLAQDQTSGTDDTSHWHASNNAKHRMPPPDQTIIKKLAQGTQSLGLDSDSSSRSTSDQATYPLPDESEVAGRAWTWQTCTELGYNATPSSDRNKSVYSSVPKLDFFRSICEFSFDRKDPPAIDITNKRYFEPLSKATKILFVNGELDPWSELSITTPPADAAKRDISISITPKGWHCSDYEPEYPDELPGKKGTRAAIDAAIARWTK